MLSRDVGAPTSGRCWNQLVESHWVARFATDVSTMLRSSSRPDCIHQWR